MRRPWANINQGALTGRWLDSTPDNAGVRGMDQPERPGTYGRSRFAMAATDDQLRCLAQAAAEGAVAAALAHHSSQITELMRGQQANDVLWAGTVVLDNSGGATGIAQMDFSVSIATIMAFNLDAATVTFAGGPGQGQAPNLTGPGSPGGSRVTGVHQIKSNTGRVFPIVGGSFVIYGNASALVDVAVYATAQSPDPS